MAKPESSKPSDLREAARKRRGAWVQDTAEWKTFLELRGIQGLKITGQTRISMCCPRHVESNPSAHIYLDRKMFRCYAGSCNAYYTDPIQFVQMLLGVTYKTAAEEFKRFFSDTSVLKNDDILFFSEEAVRYKRMGLLADAFHTHLVASWQDPNATEGVKATIEYLKNVRNVSDVSNIASLGLFPRAADLPDIFKGDKEDLDWAKTFLSKYFHYQYQDNIVFTYATSPDEVTAFKLRHSGTKDVVTIRDEKDVLGFFGITNTGYTKLYNNEKFQQSMIVEGEFDQLSLFRNQLSKGVFNEVILGASGGGNFGLDYLADIGLTKSRIVADDDQGGKSFITGLLKKTKSVACEIFEWDTSLRHPSVPAMDPDEAVKIHGFDKVYARLSADNAYIYPPRWCKDQVSAQLVNTGDEDVRAQEEVAILYGGLLSHETELEAFCALVSNDYPLLTVPGLVKHIRKGDDTDEGFTHNIVGWLHRKLHVIYMDSAEHRLHIWNKEKRAEIEIQLSSPQKTISEFRRMIKSTVVAWARDEIGLPSYFPPIETTENEKGRYDWVREQVHKRLEDAFGILSSEAAEKPFTLLSQGIHLKGVENAGTPGYMVNGNIVYKLIWDQEGKTLLSAEPLDGPADGNRVFDLEVRPQLSMAANGAWHPHIASEKDFFTRPKYSLRECYDLTFEIINSTCEFKYQKSDAQYCTLLSFYTYLIDSMQRRVMTHLLGEYESGKSSTLALLARNPQLPEYFLSYHSMTMESYTIPGIFQVHRGGTFAMGLDEANDQGEEYNNKVRKLLEILRGLATKGMADRTLGSTTQKARTQYLFNAVITASSTEIHDDMDFSRFNTLQLIKNPNKANTRILLSQKYGPSLFEDLRQSMFLNIIQAAPHIARTYQTLPADYSKANQHRLSRSVESLFPLAAVAKFIGIDYSAFVTEFSSNREEDHHTRKVSQGGFQLVDNLLNAPRLKIQIPGTDEIREMNIRSALKTAPLREAINDSMSGVYYDEKEQCIGVSWDTASQGILAGTVFNKRNPQYLRSTAFQTEDHVDREVAKQSGLYARLMSKGLAGSRSYSFFNIGKYVREIEAAYTVNQTVSLAAENAEEPDIDSGMNL